MDQRPNNYNDQGSNGQEPNGNGGPGGPKNKSSLLVLLICVLATLLIWTVFSNILQSSTSKEITYDKFLEMLDKGEVKSVELQSGVLTFRENRKWKVWNLNILPQRWKTAPH